MYIKGTEFRDLEERTLRFSKAVIRFVEGQPQDIANREISKQLIRSACSVGANYIEANDKLGGKDFLMRIKICRKEARETKYWLSLIEVAGAASENARSALIQETIELTKIFGSILAKTKAT
ncbi:four helix bundle protein [candidate division TA06 bacterium]|uniref:Four helix bundle protein n=1 Tax=candidate division TA06 bacterium TaxID=2250710 RepID=A0A933IG43_UNCT6|nr:four helix bundle protein [candidate division TA06 bacterium]